MKKSTKKVVLTSLIVAIALGVVILLNGIINSHKQQPIEATKNIKIIIVDKTADEEKELLNHFYKTESLYLGEFLKEVKNDIKLEYDDGQYGMMIHSLMGVSENQSAGEYWMFLVNNNFSEVGADATVINNDDTIEFYIEALTW